jgi:hypothetical protein
VADKEDFPVGVNKIKLLAQTSMLTEGSHNLYRFVMLRPELSRLMSAGETRQEIL